MKAIIAVTALTQALLPTEAHEPAWWYVGHSTHKTVFFIDVDRLARTGDTVRFWELSSKQAADQTPVSTLKQVEVACTARRVRVLALHASGSPAPAHHGNSTPFHHVAPGSMGEVVARFACAQPSGRRALGAFPITVPPEVAARVIHASVPETR